MDQEAIFQAGDDLVHLHWVSGMLDHNTLPQHFRGRGMVWTLHDMNPFTGAAITVRTVGATLMHAPPVQCFPICPSPDNPYNSNSSGLGNWAGI